MVRDNLGYKYHYAVADYLQRSASHIASATDVKQAYAVGSAAVKNGPSGARTAVMPVIKRVSDRPYRWKIDKAPLAKIANKEKMVPRRYISADGFAITAAGRRYLEPLIRGEDYPPYINGLPNYVTLKNVPVSKKLGTPNLWYDARAFGPGQRTKVPYKPYGRQASKRQNSFGGRTPNAFYTA